MFGCFCLGESGLGDGPADGGSDGYRCWVDLFHGWDGTHHPRFSATVTRPTSGVFWYKRGYSRLMGEYEEPQLAAAIGAEIAYWRRRRGLSRPELGAMVGKSLNTIGRWERGNTMPDVSETWKVAKALGVDLSTLIARAQDAAQQDSVVLGELFGTGDIGPDVPDGDDGAANAGAG